MIVKKCRIAYEAEREKIMSNMDESEVDYTETGEDDLHGHNEDEGLLTDDEEDNEKGYYSPPSSPKKTGGKRTVSSSSEPIAVAVPVGHPPSSSEPLVRTVTMYFPASGRSSILSEEVQS